MTLLLLLRCHVYSAPVTSGPAMRGVHAQLGETFTRRASVVPTRTRGAVLRPVDPPAGGSIR